MLIFYVYLNLCSTLSDTCIYANASYKRLCGYIQICLRSKTDLVLHLHTYIMRAAKILSRLRICIDLPKPSLIASLKISCTGTAIVRLPLPQRDDCKTRRTCEHPEKGDGGQGVWAPQSQIYRVPYQYWFGISGKSQSYQASIQCWAIISPPVCLLCLVWLFTSRSTAMVI